MSNTIDVQVKKFSLPGREETFLMAGDFVYRADNKEQAFARDEQGNWIIVRKALVTDPTWLDILEKTYSKQ